MSDATLVLEARLDTINAGQLAGSLLEHQGGDLVLDAAQVSHLGTLFLQVLRAAARQWADAGHRLSLDRVTTWEAHA